VRLNGAMGLIDKNRKTEKLIRSAKDLDSKQRVNGRLDISNVDLTFEDLNKGRFYEVDFHNVRFTGADIRDSLFRGCTFTGCEIMSVNFLETYITSCKFINCEFSKIAATFNDCNLANTKFENCSMNYVKFCFASFNNVFVSECSLKCADFCRAKLNDTKFVKCDMCEAIFDEAELEGVEFKESDLSELSAKYIVLRGRVPSTVNNCNYEGMTLTTNQMQFFFYDEHEPTKIWPEELK